jgi:hypothetical protein
MRTTEGRGVAPVEGEAQRPDGDVGFVHALDQADVAVPGAVAQFDHREIRVQDSRHVLAEDDGARPRRDLCSDREVGRHIPAAVLRRPSHSPQHADTFVQSKGLFARSEAQRQEGDG